MEVCHLLNSLGHGGAETLVARLIENTTDNVSFTVIYLGGDHTLAERMELAGATVVSLGSRTSPPQLDPAVLPRFVGAVQRRELDIVHTHMPYPHILGRLLGRTVGRVDVVSTQHIVQESLHTAVRQLDALTEPLDSATVAVSRGVQRSFTGESNLYRTSGLRDRWCTIYNGIDVDGFRAEVDAHRPSSGCKDDSTEDAVVFLNIGRYTAQKSQLDLVRAMDPVVEALPRSHLYLVGASGPLEGDLRAKARDLGITDNVTITGRVPDVTKYYADADVFVSSSIREGLPLTHLEAMSAGLPVVGTDIPGVREIIVQDETGLLVPRNAPDALASAMIALDDEADRRRMGENSFERARREFDIDLMVNLYLDLYHEVLDR